MSDEKLRLVKRFSGCYDVWSGEDKVAIAVQGAGPDGSEWIVRLWAFGRARALAFIAPTRREALKMFYDWCDA